MNQNRLNILLIDDDKLDRTAVLRQLSKSVISHEITIAETGEKGLAKLKEFSFDVVLLDYRLANMTGLEVLAIMNKENLLNMPVLMLSGMDDEALMLKCLEHGAQDFLIKSEINEKFLLRAIRYAKERRTLQQQLLTLAKYDSLTGLANRELFIDHLVSTLSNAHRRNEMLAVMFIDLDNFKQINDTMGHATGDQLLISVSNRLQKAVRDIDMVGRLGGDEFAVVLENIKSAANAAKIAEKILLEMDCPHQCSHHQLTVGCSIGIATFPKCGMNSDALIKAADTAMYAAKTGGRNDYKFYSIHMQQQVSEQANMESALRLALERDELYLHYQPLVELKTGKTMGNEAFIRWNSPALGEKTPLQFLPIAIDNGLINIIDSHVLNMACKEPAHKPGAMININVSSCGVKSKRFYDELCQLSEQNKLNKHQLVLDIDESIVHENPEHTAQLLQKIRSLGIMIAIDDFASGASSLQNLTRLPIDFLKIPPPLIADIGINKKVEGLIKSIITLAHNLNLRVIAEGVEQPQQLDFLAQNKTDFAQGYFFAKPQNLI